MKQRLVFFLLFLLPVSVYAGFNDWTQEQQNWYVVSNLVTLADWATTRDLTRRYHEGYHENNRFLGQYPTRQRVDQHFLTVLVAHYFVADSLSSRNRTLYLQVFTISQTAVVANNLRIGLNIRF